MPSQTTLEVLQAVMAFIALVCVITRVVHKVQNTSIGITVDDAFLMTAIGLGIFLTFDLYGLYFIGFGTEAVRLQHSDLEDYIYFLNGKDQTHRVGKMRLVFYAMYPLGSAFTRCSLAIDYFRLFSIVTSERLCILYCAANAFWALWGGFDAFFRCVPVQSYWHFEVPATCKTQKGSEVLMILFSICLDICIYCYPVRYLRKLRLSPGKRKALIIVFGIGTLNIALSILRFGLTIESYTSHKDGTSEIVGSLTIILCIYTGIICACLPYLRPITILFSKAASAWRTRRDNKRKRGSVDPSQQSTPHETQTQTQAQVKSDLTAEGIEMKDWAYGAGEAHCRV